MATSRKKTGSGHAPLRSKTVSVTSLKLDPANVRTHGQRNLDTIKASLLRFGQQKPIVVGKKGIVVAGNGTLAAAVALGWTRIAVVVTDLDKADAVAFAIADNRTAELAEWDDGALAAILESLEGDALEATGFNDADLEKLVRSLGQEKEAPEPKPELADELQKKWKVERGDLWVIGDHRLLCGDATSEEDTARLMGDESAGAIVTDPPYGMGLNADFSKMRGKKFKGRATGGNKYSDVTGDGVPFDPRPMLSMFPGVEDVFLWGADYYSDRIPDREKGSWLVWDKRLEDSSDRMFGSCFELCWSKRKRKRDILRVKWAGIFGMESEDTASRVHPTQKPAKVMALLIEMTKATVIADPYLGSGTTMVAAEQIGRKCCGMEIEPKYCAVILERMTDIGLTPAKG